MKKNESWLLLMHQITSKTDSFRVKIWRALQKVGAVQVKNSVYILPNNEANQQKLQNIINDISKKNGDAFLCKSEFVMGLKHEDLISLFNDDRTIRYEKLIVILQGLRKILNEKSISENKLMSIEHELGKIDSQIEEINKIDFFNCHTRQQIEILLDGARKDHRRLKDGDWSEKVERKHFKDFKNKVWVTRADIYIDRMASAWLIQKFIDPKAQFKFVKENQYQPQKNEVRFDMFNAEFGHIGDKCTFEVLAESFSIHDKRINSLKKIIHDLDIKDQKYELPETAGVKAVADGITRMVKNDNARVKSAQTLFDSIYQSL